MIAPSRLQLSRKRGFDLQAHSRAVNGLPAVNCARPGTWGNPFHHGDEILKLPIAKRGRWRSVAVATHRQWLTAPLCFPNAPPPPASFEALRGKNLACWCPPGAACHCDILIELANR